MIFRALILTLSFLSVFSFADNCKYANGDSLWDGEAYKAYLSSRSEFVKILDQCTASMEDKKIIYGKVLQSLGDHEKIEGLDGENLYGFNRYVVKYLADKGFSEFQYLFAFLHNPSDKYWLAKHQQKDYYTYIYWAKKAASQGEPNAIYSLAELSKGVFLTRYGDMPESMYFPYFTLTPAQSYVMLEKIKAVPGNPFFYSEYDFKNLLRSHDAARNPNQDKKVSFDLTTLAMHEKYKKPIWLKGDISENIPITMVLYQKGEAYEGYYFYDKAFKKWGSSFSINASIKGNTLLVNVFDQKKNFVEQFELTIKGKRNEQIYYVEGVWIANDKKLPVRLAEIELYDDHVSCEEIELAPDFIFARDIDFGMGHSSQTMEVDGRCELGMPNLEVSKKAYELANAIRLDPPWGMGCAGSSVYVRHRVESYNFMMAAYAPAIFHKKFNENYVRNRQSLDNWSEQSFYNNNIASDFNREIEELRPLLNDYYRKNVNNNIAEADLYSDVSIDALINYAAGSGENEDPKPALISMYEKDGIGIIEGRDINSYQSALNFALLNGYPENLIDELIRHVKDVNYGNESPLFYSLSSHANILKLLKSGADINYQNSFGKTVVFYAIQNSDVPLLKLLIAHGADINHKYKTKADYEKLDEQTMDEVCIQKKGRTPLMHAAQHSTVDVVKYLIKKGADTNATDDHGDKAIVYAKSANNMTVYEYLNSIKR